jgi:hypothetical protein
MFHIVFCLGGRQKGIALPAFYRTQLGIYKQNRLSTAVTKDLRTLLAFSDKGIQISFGCTLLRGKEVAV